MKLPVEFPENFTDDRPVSASQWDRSEAPAKFWRENPPPKLTIQEVAAAGIIGLVAFVFVMVIWVCLAVW